jgi:hypothetical protein
MRQEENRHVIISIFKGYKRKFFYIVYTTEVSAENLANPCQLTCENEEIVLCYIQLVNKISAPYYNKTSDRYYKANPG